MSGKPLRPGAPEAVRFERDGATLGGVVAGSGPPALFMHGLGGSSAQAEELVGPIAGVRWLLPESRGHGGSMPGDTRPFSIPLLADDALAFADRYDASGSLVAGGISLGAAAALHLAARRHRSVRGLVLVRPAWLFAATPASLAWFAVLARALRVTSVAEGRENFVADHAFRDLTQRAPAHASALLRWFDHPDPLAAADLLDGVLSGDPGITREEAARLQVPALVLATTDEEPHPLATARTLAEVLPRGRLAIVPPRRPDKHAHLTAARAQIAAFLAALPAD